MLKWIKYTEKCGIPQFEKYADTMRHWYIGIKNSFAATITNSFT